MRKITISVEDSVFAGLHKVIGKGQISKFINDLTKPYVVSEDMDAAYLEMSQLESGDPDWNENLLQDFENETW